MDGFWFILPISTSNLNWRAFFLIPKVTDFLCKSMKKYYLTSRKGSRNTVSQRRSQEFFREGAKTVFTRRGKYFSSFNKNSRNRSVWEKNLGRGHCPSCSLATALLSQHYCKQNQFREFFFLFKFKELTTPWIHSSSISKNVLRLNQKSVKSDTIFITIINNITY